MCYRLGCDGSFDCTFDRIEYEVVTPRRTVRASFQPPRGVDPRFIGTGPAIKQDHGSFVAAAVKAAFAPIRPGKTSEVLDAQLKAAQKTVADLERAKAAALHEERGQQVLLTCPDGSRHRWQCTEYSVETNYDAYFPRSRNKGKFVCRCGAKAEIT